MKLKSKDFDNFPVFEDLDDYPGLILWQLTHLWQRKFHNVLKKMDLTFVQYTIMMALDIAKKNEVESTLSNIAKGTMFDIMMTSNVIKTLEKKNFVKRKKHPNDSRAILLSLTDQGHTTLKKAAQIAGQFSEEFFTKLDKKLPDFKNHMLKLFNSNL